jgi:cation-transporting P-type ATPase E
MLSLGVLVLLAMPLTWRRLVLVGAMVAGFVALFPVPAVRRFYALELPSSHLWETLLVGAAGIVALVGFWEISRRLRPTSTDP